MDQKALYEELRASIKLLELPEKATPKKVKNSYHKLVKKWHPDRCKGNRETCLEMIKKINHAYNIVMKWVESYELPFSDEAIKRKMEDEEYWMKKFGSDPIWGRGDK